MVLTSLNPLIQAGLGVFTYINFCMFAYINIDEGLIEVDNKVLELDARVRLVKLTEQL